MLEKTPGAVLCGHCHALGAKDFCRFCRRPVHRACLDSPDCPEPHPRELRLGLGARLRDIDEEGRIGSVGHLLGGEDLRELASRAVIDEVWPAAEHRGLPVGYLEPRAFGPGVFVRTAATYTLEAGSDGEPIRVYQHPLLAQTRLVEGPDLRLVPRPRLNLDPERLLVTRNGRTAVLVSTSRFDVIDLDAVRPAVVVDLKGELIFDLAISGEMDLAVAAVFGRLRCFRLGDGQLLGAIRLEDGDVTAVALDGGRLAAVTEELRLHVRQVGGGPPDRWAAALHTDVQARGYIRPGQLSLSHDGRLLALRHRRKQVLVIDLERGERQLLRGHTDTVCLVRFIAGGRVLVTADDDNRVRFWPRSGDRIISGD